MRTSKWEGSGQGGKGVEAMACRSGHGGEKVVGEDVVRRATWPVHVEDQFGDKERETLRTCWLRRPGAPTRCLAVLDAVLDGHGGRSRECA